MKHIINQISTKLSSIALMSLVLFTACDDEDGLDWVSASNYTIMAYVDDVTYLVGAESVEEGTISVKGQGTELTAWGVSASQDGYIYLWNGIDNTIEKFSTTGGAYTLVDAISIVEIIPDGRPRAMNISDENSLLINSWADTEGNVYYGVIALSDFSVTKYGSVKMSAYGDYIPYSAELVVTDGKAYFGTLYTNEAWTDFPGLITWVYDFPSFENGQMLESNQSKGMVTSYIAPGNIIDEKGDVYQTNISSKHWFGMEVGKPIIAKLSNGVYDESYDFDLNTHFPKGVGVWGMMYAGNGIAYAKVIYEDAVDDVEVDAQWGALRNGNNTMLVKLDLYKKTVTKINIPESASFFVINGASANGKFYFPVSIAAGEANVYIIDNEGGADDFVKGAQLDGNNISVARVFAHN